MFPQTQIYIYEFVLNIKVHDIWCIDIHISFVERFEIKQFVLIYFEYNTWFYLSPQWKSLCTYTNTSIYTTVIELTGLGTSEYISRVNVKYVTYCWWCGGTVGIVASSQLQGPQFDPELTASEEFCKFFLCLCWFLLGSAFSSNHPKPCQYE